MGGFKDTTIAHLRRPFDSIVRRGYTPTNPNVNREENPMRLIAENERWANVVKQNGFTIE